MPSHCKWGSHTTLHTLLLLQSSAYPRAENKADSRWSAMQDCATAFRLATEMYGSRAAEAAPIGQQVCGFSSVYCWLQLNTGWLAAAARMTRSQGARLFVGCGWSSGEPTSASTEGAWNVSHSTRMWSPPLEEPHSFTFQPLHPASSHGWRQMIDILTKTHVRGQSHPWRQHLEGLGSAL